MNELKPCPFCNAKPKQHNPLYLHVRHEEGCALAVDGERNEVYIIEAWNTRFERTCHMSRDLDGLSRRWWRCSDCDGVAPAPDKFSFCPYCGAKVVEE